MDKAPDAFRTISEVAEVLETPAHVLRFWESRFPQIKPVKRAGGRRYYRPADVALLSGIRQLLHTEGMTIRGVQKVLREQGVRHVAGLGGELVEMDLDADLDLQAEESVAPQPSPVVVPMTGLMRRSAEPPAPQVAQVENLFPRPAPEEKPAPKPEAKSTSEVPRDGEGGFIAFSTPRSTKPKPAADPAQPSLPFEPEAPEVLEAPHVFVEAEPLPAATVTPLAPEPVARPDKTAPGQIAAEAPALAGLSARLRQLAAPLSPQTAGALAEVHSRLGLLHAQMAEAQRLRRPAV
jgi:DNA-binding transcriptional MerR regulator